MAKSVTIVENSLVARFAAWKLKGRQVAMVIGSTIYLHGCNRQQFLENKKWVRHEIAHVHQWTKFGKLRFTFLYLFESLKKGYYQNKYEVEARSKECDPSILDDIRIS